MVLIVFYIEDMKECVLSCIRAAEQTFFKGKERLPEGTKNLYKRMWKIAVKDGIISDDERIEIEGHIDYRNTIAHAIHDLTTMSVWMDSLMTLLNSNRQSMMPKHYEE